MGLEFKVLPERLSSVGIFGDYRTAFCVPEGEGFTFFISLKSDNHSIEQIDHARSYEIKRAEDNSIDPLYLTDVTPAQALDQLRDRSLRNAPLNLLRLALESGISKSDRLILLNATSDVWSEPGEQFTRVRLLTGEFPEQHDIPAALVACEKHGFPKFVPILTELIEVLPFIRRTAEAFGATILNRTPSNVMNTLLNEGVPATGSIGLARNDFAELDALTTKLSADAVLLTACPELPQLLERYSRRLRDTAVNFEPPTERPVLPRPV